MPQSVSGFGVLPMSRPRLWIAFASLPTHDLPAGDGPPAAANIEFVNDETSSAIDTSSRRSMSRDQVTDASGMCSVWSRRSSSPTRNAPVLSIVRASNVIMLSRVRARMIAGAPAIAMPAARASSDLL
ncbi:hypothetical protein FEP82_06004 [Burkholderia multivorans]|nr:hypothetical protein [Burkholderia multivorans]MDR8828960.1 hypothetical protein [Burkholderia multivorans]